MMIDKERLRARIETQDLETARAIVVRLIRRAARRRISRYAERSHITDFDSVLVETVQRDHRDALISTAQQTVVSARAAPDMPAVLLVFDQIAKFI